MSDHRYKSMRFSVQMVVESGVLLGVGFVLSLFKVTIPLPGAGSITLASMLPLVILGYKYGPLWGMVCGFVHGMLQIVEGGLYPPPVQSYLNYILVVLLDYALAWGSIGLIAGLIAKVIHKPQFSMAVSGIVGLGGRYLCSFISGVIIWGVYAPEGKSAVIYSLSTNGAYMIPEMIVTAVLAFALFSAPAMRKLVRSEEYSY